MTLLAAALWSAPCLAQSRSQLGPLCTTDTTPADQQIDACNKIIALKVFSGEKLATIYFWRAVGWNKKGNYTQVIADAGEAIRLQPSVAAYNLRGSAYYDKGEDDIAIADFNDARAIAKSLRDIGFVVTEGTDLDRTAMQTTIRDFLREAARAQIAVVYYAGHGVQVDGRNYLVPVDHRVSRRQRHDRCDDGHGYDHGRPRRSGPHQHPDPRCLPQQPDGAEGRFHRPRPRHRSRTSGLAAPATLGAGSTLGAGTLIAFATAPGQVALDGEGANSPFSAALSRHIGTPGLEVQQMLTRVRAEVVAATKSKQVPWSNSSLLGEVYLAEK